MDDCEGYYPGVDVQCRKPQLDFCGFWIDIKIIDYRSIQSMKVGQPAAVQGFKRDYSGCFIIIFNEYMVILYDIAIQQRALGF